MIFDYATAAKRAGMPQDKLERLCALVRAEFPSDEMMAELHMLRAILAIQRGDTTLEEILRGGATGQLPSQREPLKASPQEEGAP